MRTCRVKPSAYQCYACGEVADFFNQVPNCEDCSYKKERYVLVGIVSKFFNDYAYVERDGTIDKVELDRVYDIVERR